MKLLVAMLGLLVIADNSAVKFVGVEVEGKSIAFVCDGSRWSNTTIDDLAEQLMLAIDAMPPEQRVAIVFFADDKAYGPEDGQPLGATPENKQKFRDWLQRVPLGRHPTPIAGLTRAFEFKPERVVFISSGEFKDRDAVAAHVATHNAEKAVRVSTIGFFEKQKKDDSRSFVRFMEKLAADNRGEFKAVYADELNRKKGF